MTLWTVGALWLLLIVLLCVAWYLAHEDSRRHRMDEWDDYMWRVSEARRRQAEEASDE